MSEWKCVKCGNEEFEKERNHQRSIAEIKQQYEKMLC